VIDLEKTPRMADFANVLAAVDAELGTDALSRYASQSATLAADNLSSDVLAVRIQECVTTAFEGTSAQLLAKVTPKDADWRPAKDWPGKPRKVTGRMRRLAPAFRKMGWTVKDLGSENHDKLLRWNISPPAEKEKSGEDPRQPPQDPPDAGAAGVGGDDSGPSQDADQETSTLPARCCTQCGRLAGPGGILCPKCKTTLSKEGTT
jgi:hypothetical protein